MLFNRTMILWLPFFWLSSFASWCDFVGVID